MSTGHVFLRHPVNARCRRHSAQHPQLRRRPWCRERFARAVAGPMLLLGAYLTRKNSRIDAGSVKMFARRTEMLDLVVIDGHARGIITRNLVTGAVECHVADAVVNSVPEATATSITSRPTRKARTAPPSGAPTNAEPTSVIPASHAKFIRPAFRFRVTINRS